MRMLTLSIVLLALAAARAEDNPVGKANMLFDMKKYDEALKLLDAAIKKDADHAAAIDLRGSTRYMKGDFKGAVADFDRFLELKPMEFNKHWRRGIALYYVKRYEDGKKQFQGYEKVADNDVENTFWHWMCAYKKDGEKAARAGLLKTRKDSRAPMNEVLQLIQGKIKPEDVLKAAEGAKDAEKKGALFYGHLYLGLYFDVTGERKKAIEHLDLAAKGVHPSPYMGEVARVHRDWLKK